MNKIKEHRIIIFGLGKSGMSCAHYFDRVGIKYTLVDTRNNLPNQSEIEQLTHCQTTYLGNFDESILDNCKKLIVSPGIALTNSLIVAAKNRNIKICGDIDIFVENCNKKIIAITGSNGKSTVTELTENLIKAAGNKAQKAGNIGLPVLDYLENESNENEADYFVLELSSFQLDITSILSADVAVLLNISEDHMDRYESFNDYIESKRSIFESAKSKVFNLDDTNCTPSKIKQSDIGFSINRNLEKLINSNCGKAELDFIESKNYSLKINGRHIVNSTKLSLTGKHNYANILASLSVLELLDLKINEEVINELCRYQGMKHRFQLVSKSNDCDWINDSKATNVGATVAALNNFGSKSIQQLVLIAGGDSKQSDLEPLRAPLENKVENLILLGKDAKLIASLTNKIKTYFVSSMVQAVEKAKILIDSSNDNFKQSTVLLSPACASLDMYSNFEERGDQFIHAVEALK